MSVIAPAIGTLLGLMRKGSAAASIGAQVFHEMRGEEPKGAVDEAVLSMDPDEQEEWARVMQMRTDLYKAETERLKLEQGEVNAETLQVLSVEERGRIAWLRMTTRPWGVRLMILGLMSPFILVAVDLMFYILNVIFVSLGVDHWFARADGVCLLGFEGLFKGHGGGGKAFNRGHRDSV